MKYSVRQCGTWSTRVTLADKIKKAITKIITNIKGGDEKYDDPKMFGSLDSVLEWELEGAVDISSEEMLQFVKAAKEVDLNYLEVLKKLGSMAKTGAKEARLLVQEELPEWKKIISEFEKD